jgi:hypothetical protein
VLPLHQLGLAFTGSGGLQLLDNFEAELAAAAKARYFCVLINTAWGYDNYLRLLWACMSLADILQACHCQA